MAVDMARALRWIMIGSALVVFAAACRGAGEDLAGDVATAPTSAAASSIQVTVGPTDTTTSTTEQALTSSVPASEETTAETAAPSTTSSAPTTSETTSPDNTSSETAAPDNTSSETAAPSTTSPGDTAPHPAGRVLPAGNADYQIGGSYPLPDGVTIVSRDRTDGPAAGAYNICYINGFQTQPSETNGWNKDLLLQDPSGNVIIDPDWNEALLDITTPEKRTGIAAVVGGWIKQCAEKGFDGVEIDNLDTYSRSSGRISQDNAVAMMATYSSLAHAAGMDIAQKNSAEIVDRAGDLGTDFAVVEGCSRYNECSVFTSVYGSDVVMIEYRDDDFNRGCSSHGDTNPIVLRDRNVSKPGSNAYTFRLC